MCPHYSGQDQKCARIVYRG